MNAATNLSYLFDVANLPSPNMTQFGKVVWNLHWFRMAELQEIAASLGSPVKHRNKESVVGYIARNAFIYDQEGTITDINF